MCSSSANTAATRVFCRSVRQVSRVLRIPRAGHWTARKSSGGTTGDYVEFTRGPVPSMTDDGSTPLSSSVFCGVSDGGECLNTFDFPKVRTTCVRSQIADFSNRACR